MNNSVHILIPAYQPDTVLLELVQQLLSSSEFTSILNGITVVDDGSTLEESKRVFKALSLLSKVKVIEQFPNQGKGAALKYGLQDAVNNIPNAAVLVCVDADGQHLCPDIADVSKLAVQSGETVLGVREFDSRTPLRSRFGNKLTAGMFRVMTGVKIRDTQTGLRAICREDWPLMLRIKANRYEYEFYALFDLVRKYKKDVQVFPIETVYEEDNPSSHFRIFRDSALIYSVFFKVLFSRDYLRSFIFQRFFR